MKKVFLVSLLFGYSQYIYAQNAMSFDNAQRLYDSLSNREMKDIVKKSMQNLCLSELPKNNSTSNYCNCFADNVLDELKGNQIKDILLPQTHLRYMTESERQQKLINAMAKTMQQCTSYLR